jgi:DNA-binding GntR family transcriptional regulator
MVQEPDASIPKLIERMMAQSSDPSRLGPGRYLDQARLAAEYGLTPESVANTMEKLLALRLAERNSDGHVHVADLPATVHLADMIDVVRRLEEAAVVLLVRDNTPMRRILPPAQALPTVPACVVADVDFHYQITRMGASEWHRRGFLDVAWPLQIYLAQLGRMLAPSALLGAHAELWQAIYEANHGDPEEPITMLRLHWARVAALPDRGSAYLHGVDVIERV